MKHLFYLTFTLLLVVPHQVNAVSAYPYPIEYKQPDESTITIVLKGDERVHWATSVDGYTLLLSSTGFYEYAKKAVSGDLTLSGIRAHNPDKRTPEETVFLKKIMKDLRYSSEQVNVLKQVWETKETALKTKVKSMKNRLQKAQTATGIVRAPLILVQFPDKPFIRSKQDFELLMNQPDYTATTDGSITGSVYDYFYDNSYGQLEFQVDVFGPYTLAHNIAYYDFYSNGNPAIMAREAALAAATDGCNFADYDSDENDFVDALHLIFAGYGQEAGAPKGDAIWSHASFTYTEDNDFLAINNKIVYWYSCSPELRDTYGTNISYIGVIAHELSHVFGLPDFYDTDYDEQGQSVDTGEWDIMARGSWNDGGRTPANHNAWSKNYLGWVPAVELAAITAITLPNPALQGAVYRISTTTLNEYFLLENRQKQGWDAYIPSSGMLIYHVDENMDWDDNCLNCIPSHRGLYIKQAGGGINSNNTNRTNDPYPSGGNTAFTDASVPNSKSWAGNNTNKPVTQITHNTAERTVSFQFMASQNSYDASLNRFADLPTVSYNSGAREIKVELENHGKEFTAATISWSIDGQMQTPYQWSGSLPFGQKEILTIGSANLTLGAYTLSASVIVVDDEQTSNNTIQAVIEIKEQEKLPYATEFSGSLSGWESVSIAGDIDWQWSDQPNYLGYIPINTSSSANGYALYGIVRDDMYPGPNPAQAALISPPFNFPEGEKIDLSFEYITASYSVTTFLRVQASTDNFQEQIVDVWSQTLLNSLEIVVATPLVDLSAFAGKSNVRIRFLYEGGYAFGWAIDDIKLFVNNTPTLKSLTVTPGELSPAFNPNIMYYTVNVMNDVSVIDINAVALRPSDIVNGTGTQVLNEGETIFSVVVSSADDSKQYTIVVNRMAPALAVPFIEDFESGATAWTIENGSYPNRWHIGTATAASGNYSAYISDDGGISNSYNSNTSSIVELFCNVYFTPRSEDYHIYRLSFDWKGVGENYFDYMEVVIINQVGDFTIVTFIDQFSSADTWQKAVINLSSSYLLSGTVQRLVFRWKNDSSVEGQPPIAIDNVKIQLVDPYEALLSDLSVDEGVLSPAFYSNTFNYNVTVNNSVTKINMNATAMRSIDKISGTGTYPLNEGNNLFEVVVSNPEGTVQNTYRVVVDRMKPMFSVPFTEDFESTTNLWKFANDTQPNQWVIGSATAASGNYSAYISNDGGISNSYTVNNSSLVYLFCDVYFTPYTEYGYYQLNFDWKGMGESYCDYMAIYLTDTDIDPNAGNRLSYSAYLGQFSLSSTWKKAIPNIPNYYQGSIKRLVFMWENDYGFGEQPPIAIDNIAIKYIIPTDATLSKLSVNSGVLSPAFDPHTFHYMVNVDKSVNQIRMEAEANNPNAIVVGANEDLSLNVGANTFHILVLAEDINYRNTYSVVVNRSTGTSVENPETAIKVYPVPTTGKIYIENAGGAEVSVYNLPGELLLCTKQSSIDLSAYPNGIYLLQVGNKKIKVVKQ
ncbi:MAG: M6 family metalloprotease domain-containing protein [Dysgonamonadaceae bacterium]|jgi:M6 family metalloprotease-like protein|nr:M6 family metalloprotease domain-containing protein [Dysgonamonadaceae bacterium]